jgi:hypothetical protein
MTELSRYDVVYTKKPNFHDTAWFSRYDVVYKAGRTGRLIMQAVLTRGRMFNKLKFVGR